ncbi:LacI family DNA-binding transcriptional regulator [Streptomyces marincola]|uniref:LacI family DNA-binding transcriptional regulator n=1 Tax=Streptomyces marincola TaxID=2878388 RepID=UPI001CF2FC75|nr:LacI family DNA-binding transcriptional regulator [Streptomyces marincola]UCM91620.1 LacI family DNA-binding transcriptional regulator [Streptomyces marincola]
MTSADTNAPADGAPTRPLTTAQLAERAGVSIATVSKVVNGRAEVAAETREIVEALIRRHGYRRQKKASGPAPMLELIFHELAGPYPAEIVKGVQRVAWEHSLAVAVAVAEPGPQSPRQSWIESVLARRPTGVIAVFSALTDAQVTQLHTRDIPLVLLDPVQDSTQDCPVVGASNWSGGMSATRHLLDLGHRRIAAITGPPHSLASRARLDGYRAALDMHGAPVDDALVRVGDFYAETGLAHTRDLLRLPDPPTAVVACNDGTALGVYRAAAEAGLRVPDDLSVVGFDDLFPSSWLTPPLTTVRQPLTEMAATAATMAITVAQGNPLAQKRVELTTELVVRGSTSAPTAP